MFFKKDYKKEARKNLLNAKEEDVAIFELLEAYLTEKIMEGEKHRAKDLAGIQQKIEETNRFIKFLKKI